MKTFKKYIKENTNQRAGVIESIHLENLFIEELPEFFKNLDVARSIYLGRNKLKTLKNFPKSIGHTIYLPQNELVSLNGLPNRLNGPLILANNKLQNLHGFPQEIRTELYINIDYNQLSTLEGFPKGYVPDIFSIEFNSLKNLIGGPKVVGSDFYIGGNPLESLDGFPHTIYGDLYVGHDCKFKEKDFRMICEFEQFTNHAI